MNWRTKPILPVAIALAAIFLAARSDANDILYVFSPSDSLCRINTNGTVSVIFAPTNGLFDTSFSKPVVGVSGNVFAIATANNFSSVICKFTTNGVKSVFAPATNAIGSYPYYKLAIDSRDNLYSPDIYNNIIYKYTTNGVPSVFAQDPSQSPYDDMTFDTHGNLFVADSIDGAVFEVTPVGGVTLYATNIDFGSYIAIDSYDNLYVTSVSTNTIYKCTPDRIVSFFAAMDVSYSPPGPMAFDSRGNLLISDGGIYEFKNLGGGILNPNFVTYSTFQNTGPFAIAPTIPTPNIVSIGNKQYAVYWPANGNYRFALQTSTNLASTNWTTVSNGTLNICITVTNPAPNAFYRLQIQ